MGSCTAAIACPKVGLPGFGVEEIGGTGSRRSQGGSGCSDRGRRARAGDRVPKWPPPPSGWTNVFNQRTRWAVKERRAAPGPAKLSRGEPIKTFGPTDATAEPNPVAAAGPRVGDCRDERAGDAVEEEDAAGGRACGVVERCSNDQVDSHPRYGRAETRAGLGVRIGNCEKQAAEQGLGRVALEDVDFAGAAILARVLRSKDSYRLSRPTRQTGRDAQRRGRES